MKDRHILGTIHWQNRPISSEGTERGEVMCAYFAMLWRFERLHTGRKVLLEENNNVHDIALTILDREIQTHVVDYVCAGTPPGKAVVRSGRRPRQHPRERGHDSLWGIDARAARFLTG
ncbi:hypothetical protein ACFV4P_35135 [Kitasatospora sp. NPDC059795]|uniref:hypothetical protein n=1 Tax=Kitasatospora sp. NPDC059795 TaxID=3346949 RepID=UPI003667BA99